MKIIVENIFQIADDIIDAVGQIDFTGTVYENDQDMRIKIQREYDKHIAEE